MAVVRAAATAPIQTLAWEPPYATGAALKRPPPKKKIHKGEGGGAYSHAHILQKFAAGLVKVATNHRHYSSSTDVSVFLDMRRYKNWAHKI